MHKVLFSDIQLQDDSALLQNEREMYNIVLFYKLLDSSQDNFDDLFESEDIDLSTQSFLLECVKLSVYYN